MLNRLIKFICFIFIASLFTACSNEAKLQTLDTNATVLAFGDSLTYGTGTSLNKAYPAILEQLIQRKVINAGIPGEISKDGLARLPALIKTHQPSLIIICHGGNDILRGLDLSKTRDNIQQMIDLARQNNSQVILIGVPEFGLFLDTVSLYPELAKKNKIPITADILSEIISNNTLKSDHIHPNAQGYQILAESIDALLRNAGALPNG
ncbi:lipolytic enzyme, G-D-S-L [hydrothermal vent metagenome]|uniref:Lipolytic enzyme, G-D-S-L n=1 Tax=hydrothermal vent metagenome TaxID=652676 RepID=A0A3B0WMN3_9ZZZZ